MRNTHDWKGYEPGRDPTCTDGGMRTAAWKMARGLWQAEIDKMYEALYNAAKDVPSRLTLLNERMMFNAQVNVYEAALTVQFPDDAETVAKKIAELLMNKSNDLCYEIHTAPSARVDSYLHEHTA
ncbi:MAG: hypothetical protein IJ048_13400, partial [Clostridia bacterium]|nr:hypothetical protein [Clostridia bacterium]